MAVALCPSVKIWCSVQDFQIIQFVCSAALIIFLLQVLKKEFPKGIDIIYESVGGEMFNMCLNALAVYGRLVVIGMISQVCFLVNGL